MSFPEEWKQALASESEPPQVPLEVRVTCAYHGLVLEPYPFGDLAPEHRPWACPDPNCPVKAHIVIRTPAPQEEA